MVRYGACGALYADCVVAIDDFMRREKAICECHNNVKDALKGNVGSSILYMLICTEVGEVLDNYCGN